MEKCKQRPQSFQASIAHLSFKVLSQAWQQNMGFLELVEGRGGFAGKALRDLLFAYAVPHGSGADVGKQPVPAHALWR
jgi:hypothetical protein